MNETLRLRPDVAAIQVLRLQRGWSQAELAAQSGISRPAISRLEAGLHSPRPATVKAIAKALRVPVQTLWTIEEGAVA